MRKRQVQFPYYIVRFKHYFLHICTGRRCKFPYYIVRFKQISSWSVECIAGKFPYYIVRFKRYRFFRKVSDANQFPYYIVRFKRTNHMRRKKCRCSFHTTQYDLNPYLVIPLIIYFLCFHTTQYDLNQTIRTLLVLAGKFPYYIVRFKQYRQKREYVRGVCFHTTQYDLNFDEASYKSFVSPGFHTTQYDLNLFSFPLFIDYLNLFPYYIVRFKRKCILRK